MENIRVINLLIRYKNKEGEILVDSFNEYSINKVYQEASNEIDVICIYKKGNNTLEHSQKFYVGQKTSIAYAKTAVEYLTTPGALDILSRLERYGFKEAVSDNNYNPLYGLKPNDKVFATRTDMRNQLTKLYKEAISIIKMLSPQLQVNYFTKETSEKWIYDTFGGLPPSTYKVTIDIAYPSIPVSLNSRLNFAYLELYVGELYQISDLLLTASEEKTIKTLNHYAERYSEVIILANGALLPKTNNIRVYKTLEELKKSISTYYQELLTFQTLFSENPETAVLPTLIDNSINHSQKNKR